MNLKLIVLMLALLSGAVLQGYSRYERREGRRHHGYDRDRGDRMARGFFGGAATGALIGGIVGGGRGAGIGLGVGATTGLMAGAAASHARDEEYYDEPYDEQNEEYYDN